LRRAVRLGLLVAGTAARDLLLQAKHLVFAAIVARRRVAGAISLSLQEIAQAGSPRAGQGIPEAEQKVSGRSE